MALIEFYVTYIFFIETLIFWNLHLWNKVGVPNVPKEYVWSELFGKTEKQRYEQQSVDERI